MTIEERMKKVFVESMHAIRAGDEEKIAQLIDEATDLALKKTCSFLEERAADLREMASRTPTTSTKSIVRMNHAADTLEQAAGVILAGGEVTVDGRDNH